MMNAKKGWYYDIMEWKLVYVGISLNKYSSIGEEMSGISPVLKTECCFLDE